MLLGTYPGSSIKKWGRFSLKRQFFLHKLRCLCYFKRWLSTAHGTHRFVFSVCVFVLCGSFVYLIKLLNFRVASYRKITRMMEYPCASYPLPPSLASDVSADGWSLSRSWMRTGPLLFTTLHTLISLPRLTCFSHLGCHGTSNPLMSP